MMKMDRHDDQFQQMMAPFYGTPVKMQNMHPADVQRVHLWEMMSLQIIMSSWSRGNSQIPPLSQILHAINDAKSTICDMLSEAMANTTIPPGFEEGYAQPVMAPAAW